MNRTSLDHGIKPTRAEITCVLSAKAQIGEGPVWSVAEQRLYWADITGKQLDVRQVPGRMRDGDGHLISDPGKLMQATGWKPACDLQTGLRLLLESEGLV